MWKEKQRQVKAEEEKTKNSKSVVFDNRTSNLVLRPQAPGAADIVEEESWNKHKWVISDVCYRELWTEQAEILIRQVHLARFLFWKFFAIVQRHNCDDKSVQSSYVHISFHGSNMFVYYFTTGPVSTRSAAFERSKSVCKGECNSNLFMNLSHTYRARTKQILLRKSNENGTTSSLYMSRENKETDSLVHVY